MSAVLLDERAEIEEDYVGQPLQVPIDARKALENEFNINTGLVNIEQRTSSRGIAIIEGPKRGINPISDFNQPGVQGLAFPHLFPSGDPGDCTAGDHDVRVGLKDGNQHLLWYAVEKPDGNGYIYPFAEDSRWMHWACNTCERHCLQGQKSLYLDKNPGDANLTGEEIQEIITSRDSNKLKGILARMQMYTGNITGSDAYFARERRKLESLFDCKFMPTIWWTFSAADNHWYDLHQVSKMIHQGDEATKAKERRRWVRDNQHMVDSFFVLRLKTFINKFFGEEGLRNEYFWFRIEYQGRGTAHAHGCCRLESDPGLTTLARRVSRGKNA